MYVVNVNLVQTLWVHACIDKFIPILSFGVHPYSTGDLPSLLENNEREEITTRPCPVVTIQEQLPCELEPPATSVEDEEDDCDTQQNQICKTVQNYAYTRS